MSRYNSQKNILDDPDNVSDDIIEWASDSVVFDSYDVEDDQPLTDQERAEKIKQISGIVTEAEAMNMIGQIQEEHAMCKNSEELRMREELERFRDKEKKRREKKSLKKMEKELLEASNKKKLLIEKIIEKLMEVIEEPMERKVTDIVEKNPEAVVENFRIGIRISLAEDK